MKYPKIPICLLAAAMSASTLAVADDDDELEFEEAFLYFELNDTDGDLGLHGKVDGDGWKKVKIEGPNDRKILDLKVKSGLKRQGMTELFFESSEPTFDELDPEVFFDRFPAGLYEWEGKTLDGKEIEGEVFLSQRIPAAPVVASVGNGAPPVIDEDGELGCWGKPSGTDVTIDWDAVTKTHASLGSDTGAPLVDDMNMPPLVDNGVIYYEFVAEVDETDYKMTAVVPPGTTAWTVPAAFIAVATGAGSEEVKFEIVVRVETGEYTEEDDGETETIDSRPGNQSAVESCFLLVEEEDEGEDEGED